MKEKDRKIELGLATTAGAGAGLGLYKSKDFINHSLFKGPTGPVFGKDIKEKLTGKDLYVVTRHNSTGDVGRNNFTTGVLRRLGLKDYLNLDKYRNSDVKNSDKATLIDLRRTTEIDGGMAPSMNTIAPSFMSKSFTKADDAKIFKNYMPETILPDPKVMKNSSHADIINELAKKWGKNNWILKKFNADGRDPDSVIKPENADRYKNYAKEDFFAQRRYNIDKEYRVHAYNGKVIPYATYNKSDKTLSFKGKHPGLFQSKSYREAENLISDAMQHLPNKDSQNKIYGFDVARNKDTGKWFIIESNALERKTGTSGYLDTPQAVDAFISAGKGKLPAHILRPRLAVGAAALTLGAGAVGGAIYLNKEKKDVQK